MLTHETIKVGMHVRCIYHDDYYCRGDKTGVVIDVDSHQYVTVDWDDSFLDYTVWAGARYFEKFDGKKRKPRKVIPDMPLDPSLPILMAGHLQDRMRKKS